MRFSGALLAAGFTSIPGVAFAISSQTGTEYIPPTLATRAGAILLLATRSLPLGGLTVFDSILWMRGTDGCHRFRWPHGGIPASIRALSRARFLRASARPMAGKIGCRKRNGRMSLPWAR
jgi:hypothetical protein